VSKVGIVKIRQATRPSIVSQNYSAKIDISDLSGVNLGGIKEGDILVYSANTGNFEVRTASISGNNDSALPQYAANHANAAFTYANTISGGSAIDNVARVAAASAQSTAGLAYNHANAAFNAANSGSSSVFTQSAYNHANAAFTSANSINGVNTTQNNSITAIDAVNVTQNNRITAAFNHANAAFNAANTGGAAGVDTYARNHANAAFAYANTISGGSAIDNVARTSAASAQSTAGLAYNHANAAYDKANSANILAQAAFNTANNANTRTIINGLGNSKLDFNTYGANSVYLTTTSDDSTALFMGTATAELYAYTNIQIRANTGGTSKAWTFGEDGTLTFPDNSSLSINTGGIVAGAITATSLLSNTYIQFGDGSRQYTANAGTGGGGSDYFPTNTDWGYFDSLISAFGENLAVQYDCRDEPITPRGYLLQKDFGYLT